MKKIYFFLPTLNVGGIERVFITYANYFSENNLFNVSFLLCKKDGMLLSTVSSKVRIVDLGNVKLRYSFYKLRKWIRTENPDFILTGGDFPNFVAIISSIGLKSKVVISQHNYFNIESKRLGIWAYSSNLLMKVLYPKADKIIAISDGIFNFLKKEIKIKSNNLVKIPNPINIDTIKKRSNDSINIKLPSKFIVFIGRLSYVKNLPFLIEAFECANLDDDVHLVVVGNGEMKGILEEKVHLCQKKNKILFMGSFDNPLPILKRASLLVLPSFSEAYPTILLEALCLNVPILATPTKGALEILENIPGTFISKDCYDTNAFSSLLEKGIKSSLHLKKATMRVNLHSVDIIGKKIKFEILDEHESFS